MSVPILTTKLYIPPPRPLVVERTRLIERLNAVLRQSGSFATKLTLISAPAGFGKTSLVSEWIHQTGRQGGVNDGTFRETISPSHVGWLSLDEGDNDPIRFLVYLIAALQTLTFGNGDSAGTKIGEGALRMLQSPQPPPSETILTALLNEIAALPLGLVLVLDDYHVIDTKPVDNALAFLVEHLPPQMHLVITTRQDPDLPLARLRARGQLTELRAADLRFTPSEAAEFFNKVMRLRLSPQDIDSLETRTEGWIAGLQLAALALQGQVAGRGQRDAADFIKSFTGSHRFVMDYLVQEVLGQQSASVQTFLLHTSILVRLCGPLCDAVLSAPLGFGQTTLEYLEQANLLLFPLDDTREWYRYHHLFADVLQARLQKEQPNQVKELHLRASVWYGQHELGADAIHHALAAGDFERAADFIELERSLNRGTNLQSATWLGWVKSLPDDIVRNRSVLSVGYAWELLFLGQLEAADARLKDAEHLLGMIGSDADSFKPSTTDRVVEHNADIQSSRALVAIARAFQAQALGDAAGTIQHAGQALRLCNDSDHYTRGLASSLLGVAYWAKGELESAYQYMADGMASVRLAGSLLFATTGTFVKADIRIAQGRLWDAIGAYQEALQLVAAEGEPALQTAADMYLGLSGLYREQGNLESARQYLVKSKELGKRDALQDWSYRLQLAQARVREDEGDLDGALEFLEAAERLYYRTPLPLLRPLAALKARVWIRQGRLEQAMDWALGRKLSAADNLTYLREFEHITLARLLIASYKRDASQASMQEAVGLLERLLQAAEAGDRMGSVIEILMLQALAQQAQGNISAALPPLERALILAEPQGYVRLFVNEGLPLAQLLVRFRDEAMLSSPLKEYVQKLLALFGNQLELQPLSGGQDKPLPPAKQSILDKDKSYLIEPLSQRELEILQLVAQGLSNQEISERLFVALSTVKGHNRNIFDKLQVSSRTQAIERARQLGLV